MNVPCRDESWTEALRYEHLLPRCGVEAKNAPVHFVLDKLLEMFAAANPQAPFFAIGPSEESGVLLPRRLMDARFLARYLPLPTDRLLTVICSAFVFQSIYLYLGS
jgi:hypothetical protein